MATTEAPEESGLAMRPSLPVKLAYSLGQAAQNGGFDAAIAFIFFYYSAVLGLSGSLVGAALAVSLAFDAVVDPVVGSWSDNIKSRLGRRLPLMIAAIPLISLSVGLLFSPPHGLGQTGLFLWLAVMSVAVRSFISLFNVPYIALGAEMATGYAERTSIVVYRALAGLFASVAVTAIGFSVYFAHGGLQRPEGYPGFGWSVAALLFACTTVCCLGIRRYAAALPQPDQAPGSMLRRLPSELKEIFANRSFRLLFISAVVIFAAMGANASLNNHAFVFVWKMRSETIQFISYAYLVGILLGVLGAPLMQKLMEKKYVVIVGFLLLIANWVALQGAMLAGLYHPLGDAAVLPMQINSWVAGIGTGFVLVAYPSMMADAADEHEYLFGRRREGLYFAGLGFAGKAATGLGVMVAGVALDMIHFPRSMGHSVGASLPEAMQFRLVAIWGPVPAIIAIVSLVILASYGITRARHDKIAAALGR
ncbi:MFS transporter [Sphingomonas sp. SUN039]|uniref:MFS transporter n=1 Tax=Sphingomonas sp. SUN039 TaxID=2937787 RepID=UPI0021644E3E|nr:MFS transporter [Sphingomonas sp. SUN039]UVO55295.1 MFS transporter [Sphingomonas sp. SUN039]